MPFSQCSIVRLYCFRGDTTKKYRRQIPRPLNVLNPQRKYFQAGEGESHREFGELSLESLHIDPQGPGPAGDKHGNPLQVSEIQEQQEPVPP